MFLSCSSEARKWCKIEYQHYRFIYSPWHSWCYKFHAHPVWVNPSPESIWRKSEKKSLPDETLWNKSMAEWKTRYIQLIEIQVELAIFVHVSSAITEQTDQNIRFSNSNRLTSTVDPSLHWNFYSHPHFTLYDPPVNLVQHTELTLQYDQHQAQAQQR